MIIKYINKCKTNKKMNIILKYILIAMNLGMIYLSYNWYLENKEFEPLISIIAQITALLVLLFENKLNSFISAKKNIRSNVDIDAAKGDTVKVNKNEDSEIKIKTRD